MKPIALAAAGLLLGAPAMALETGVRHTTGHSHHTYSGRSTTESRVNGSVTERSVSGSVGHGFNGSFGGRTLQEDYSSVTNSRERFTGGSRMSFSESSTFSR